MHYKVSWPAASLILHEPSRRPLVSFRILCQPPSHVRAQVRNENFLVLRYVDNLVKV